MSLHRVTLTQTLKGQRIQNVFHLINLDGVFTDAQLIGHVQGDWIQHIKTCQSTALRYIQIAIQRLGVGAPGPTVQNVDIAGTWTGFDPRTPFIAFKIQKKTNVGGRRGRGRYYVAGVNEAEFQTDGSWSTGTITGRFQPAVDQIKNKWLPGGSLAGLRLVVAPHDAQVETDAIDVTLLTVANFCGLQRRRSIGVGM